MNIFLWFILIWGILGLISLALFTWDHCEHRRRGVAIAMSVNDWVVMIIFLLLSGPTGIVAKFLP